MIFIGNIIKNVAWVGSTGGVSIYIYISICLCIFVNIDPDIHTNIPFSYLFVPCEKSQLKEDTFSLPGAVDLGLYEFARQQL